MARNLHLNLASEPFRRDRALIVGSAALSVVLVLLLMVLVSLAVRERGLAEDARASLEQLTRQTTTQQNEVARLEGILRQSENAVVLDRSIFLNTLIQRKAISWTRIFSDISGVLPPDVRLIAVRPQIVGTNQVVLDMTVAASTSRPVVNFLMKLEGSPVFGSTAVVNWRPPSQNENFYTYRVTANYAQKL